MLVLILLVCYVRVFTAAMALVYVVEKSLDSFSILFSYVSHFVVGVSDFLVVVGTSEIFREELRTAKKCIVCPIVLRKFCETLLLECFAFRRNRRNTLRTCALARNPLVGTENSWIA